MHDSVTPSECAFFDYMPIPLLEFDFSEVKKYILSLIGGGSDGLETYLREHPENLQECASRAELTAANKGALDLYRAKNFEELKQGLANIIGQDGLFTLLKGISTMVNGASSFEGETVNKRLDGLPLTILLRLSVPPEYRETLKLVIVTAIDITKNRQLENEINTLSLLPEANPNIVLILECPDRIRYINPTGRKWLKENGFTDEREIHRILPPDFENSICGDCDRISEQKHKVEYEEQIFDLKLKPLAGAEKCMVTLTDVTAFERISRERILYYEAFQSSIHGMMLTDAEGKIQYVNPKFEEIYGYPIAQARGRQPNILNPGKEVYRDLGYSDAEYDDLFRDMWKSISDPDIGYWEGEIPNRRKDGEIIWVHLIINAIFCEAGTITNYLAIPIDVSETRKRELSIRLDIYHTITELAELRDNETGQHIIRVGKLSRLVAEGLGMPKKFCNDIENFAPLHDIGKVGISDTILLAERKLTPEEFDIMKNHSTLGYRLLAGKPTLEMAADIAYGHHEKYEGGGYPLGIGREEIPLAARITALVDVYDALRSKRPYKGPWTHERSVEEIIGLSGSHFDPEIVEVFRSKEKEFSDVSNAYRDPDT